MRAVVYEAFGAMPTLAEVPDPTPDPDGAVVRVTATGLCRSDWHGWVGHDPDIVGLPHVPGHEFAGVVEAVGRDVRRWHVGDRVTAPFVCACGACAQCAAGDHQICDHQSQPGFTHWGSFAERIAIAHADVNLVTIPDGVETETAALLGCRFATAYRALLQVGRLVAGEWVAVHGCGGVGLSAIMIAVAAGARVIAVDVSPAALDLARDAGAELAVAAGTDVRDHTGGGTHIGLDAIGHEDACRASIAGLRKRGRHVQIGLLPDGAHVPMELVIGRELQLLGSHGMAAHAYPEMLSLIAADRLRPGRLITSRIELDQAPAALATMAEAPRAGVTIIRP
jgi:D-arabinose 1-dehydrogenase-like Zn-dependent alcohol dehydrogenase